jgi:hypothetical protein
MEPFRRLAAGTIARDAGYVALAAGTFMVGFSFHPALALLIGANVALIYGIALIVRSWRLTDERIARSEPWRALDRPERPKGDAGRQAARGILEELLLRSARIAAAIAIVMAVSSLAVSTGRQAVPQVVAAAGAHALQSVALR